MLPRGSQLAFEIPVWILDYRAPGLKMKVQGCNALRPCVTRILNPPQSY